MTALERSYLLGGFRTLKNGEDIKRTLRVANDAEGTLDVKKPKDVRGTVFERIGTGL
jgi:hypothetical protein